MKAFNEKLLEVFSYPHQEKPDSNYNTADKAVSYNLYSSNRGDAAYNSGSQPHFKVQKSNPKHPGSRSFDSDGYQPIRKLRSLTNNNESFNRDSIENRGLSTNESFFKLDVQKKSRAISQNNSEADVFNRPYLHFRPEGKGTSQIKQTSIMQTDSQLTFEDSLNLLSNKSPREAACNDETVILDGTAEFKVEPKKVKVRRIASLGKQPAPKKEESADKFQRAYDWRKQHAILMQSMRGPGLNEPDLAKEHHIKCEFCTRSFDPLVAKRHIPKCREIINRPNPPKKDISPRDFSIRSIVKRADISFTSEARRATPIEEPSRNIATMSQRQPVRPYKYQRNFQTDQSMDTDQSLLDYSLQQYISERVKPNVLHSCTCSDKHSEGSCDKCRSTNCSNPDLEDKLNQTFNMEPQNHTFAKGWSTKRQKQNIVSSSYILPALLQYKPNGYEISVQDEESNKKSVSSASRERIQSSQKSEGRLERYSKTSCTYCNKTIPSKSLKSHMPLCKALKNQSSKLLYEYEQSGFVESGEQSEKYFSVPKLENKKSEEKTVTNQITSRDFESKFVVAAKDPSNKVSSANPLLNRLRFSSQRTSSQFRNFDVCKYCGTGIAKAHAYCGICGKKKLL